MPNNHEHILYFISLIRESAPPVQQRIFTRGACYQFYLILKEVFPDALPFCDMSHVITRIGQRFYDIDGEVADVADYTVLEMTPHGWGRRFLEAVKFETKGENL